MEKKINFYWEGIIYEIPYGVTSDNGVNTVITFKVENSNVELHKYIKNGFSFQSMPGGATSKLFTVDTEDTKDVEPNSFKSKLMIAIFDENKSLFSNR